VRYVYTLVALTRTARCCAACASRLSKTGYRLLLLLRGFLPLSSFAAMLFPPSPSAPHTHSREAAETRRRAFRVRGGAGGEAGGQEPRHRLEHRRDGRVCPLVPDRLRKAPRCGLGLTLSSPGRQGSLQESKPVELFLVAVETGAVAFLPTREVANDEAMLYLPA